MTDTLQSTPPRLYHRSPDGPTIAREGFRDGVGSYMLAGQTLTGVWVSDIPLDANEGAKGEDLLEISLHDGVDLSQYEVCDDGRGYREWCVPASLISSRAVVRLLSKTEADEDADRRAQALASAAGWSA